MTTEELRRHVFGQPGAESKRLAEQAVREQPGDPARLHIAAVAHLTDVDPAYQRPGAAGNADSIRIMEPTDRYPRGYFRYYNDQGQALDAAGKPGPNSATHFSEDYAGPTKGWPR